MKVSTCVFDEVRAAYRNAASQRSRLYLFLSTAFRYPSQEVVEELREREGIDMLDEMEDLYLAPPSLAGTVESFTETIITMGDILDLQVEYTRLFIGPFRLPAPPYESVYRGPKAALMGESALGVRKMYLEESLDLSGEIHDLPDHIIVETEFMSYLSEQEALSWENDPEKAGYYLEKQDIFLTEHLTQWMHMFSQAVCAHSREEFYCLLTRLTEGFVFLDRDYVRAIQRHLKCGDEGNGDTSL